MNISVEKRKNLTCRNQKFTSTTPRDHAGYGLQSGAILPAVTRVPRSNIDSKVSLLLKIRLPRGSPEVFIHRDNPMPKDRVSKAACNRLGFLIKVQQILQ